MAVELHAALTHSYGDAQGRDEPFGDTRAAEAIQAFDPVYLTRLPGAVLSGGHVISSNGTILSWGAPGASAWKPLRNPIRLAGTFLCLTELWDAGYAHWLLDILPRMMAMSRLDQTATRFLVSKPFPAWKAQALYRAGVDLALVTVLEDQPTQVDTLYLVGPIGSPAHCHPLAAKWLKETYLARLPTTGLSRLIYLTRRRAASRHLSNEAELLEVLEPLGFDAVDAELLTFDAQVEVFRNASVVVGVHGAGLANLVFCPQGSAVLELRPPAYPQFSYEWLSAHCGLRYRSALGTPADSWCGSMPIGRQDFAIDPARVLSGLADLGVSV